MKIIEFKNLAIAADGGTTTCELVLENGISLSAGIDCRIPKTKSERIIFLGAGAPSHPNAEFLIRGSVKEVQTITAVQDYLNARCNESRQRQLLESDFSLLEKSEYSDYIACVLLRKILDR